MNFSKPLPTIKTPAITTVLLTLILVLFIPKAYDVAAKSLGGWGIVCITLIVASHAINNEAIIGEFINESVYQSGSARDANLANARVVNNAGISTIRFYKGCVMHTYLENLLHYKDFDDIITTI
jgi:hypothetical protein